MAEGSEEVGGGDVDGGEVGGAGGAVCEGAGDDARVDSAGFGGVAEGGFEGEGVCFEPVEEGRRTEDARVGVLRGVDVCVLSVSLYLCQDNDDDEEEAYQ